MSFFAVRTGTRRHSTSIETLHSMGCLACPLRNSGANTSDMAPHGPKNADLYVLGEAPGQEEDERGEPFIGKSGRLLRRCLTDYSNIRISNVVRTRPPNNRTPVLTEIECCRPSVIADIEKTKPKAILVLGNTPLHWITKNTSLGIMDMQGRKFCAMVGKHPVWIFPTIHPSAVLRRGGINTLTGKCFQRDIRSALEQLHKLKPPKMMSEKKLRSHVDITGKNYDEIMSRLDRFVLKAKEDEAHLVGFDIETTSQEKIRNRALRPYGRGAQIVSVGFSIEGQALAVPIHHSDLDLSPGQKEKVKERIAKVFTKDLGKVDMVAHNLPFDMEWLSIKLDKNILGCKNLGCSMAQAYVLDCRRGISLDNTFGMRFGISVKSLSSIVVSDIYNAPLTEMLEYCAIDAKACRLLFKAQRDEIVERDLLKVYADQARRARALVSMQVHGGLLVHSKAVEKKDAFLEEAIRKQVKKIRRVKEIRKYEEQTGMAFNPSSSSQCKKVLAPIFRQASEGTGKTVLESVKHPLAKSLLTYRSLDKMQGTYIKPYRENGKYLWPGGLIRPAFNSVRTKTRRLASSDPNGQNFPKREQEHMRDIFVSGEGRSFVSIDYSQIEARVLAMASKDERLTKAIKEGYDIHTEWAEKIDKRTKGQWIGKGHDAKTKRQMAKGSFVFPLFYGASAASMANNLKANQLAIEFLASEFWSLFPQIRKWQQSIRTYYEKNGYLDLLTGFSIPGIRSENQLFNYPIQGTASDIVVAALCRLCELAFKHDDPNLCPVLNIHDDLTFELPDDEIDDYLKIIVPIMLKTVYRFMKEVPIDVEVTIGKKWGSMKEHHIDTRELVK